MLRKISLNDYRLSFIRNLFITNLGPAVTLDDHDNLYVFGGYDLVSGSAEFRNDFFELENLSSTTYETSKFSLNFNQSLFRWIRVNNTLIDDKNKSQVISPRARPLLVAFSENVMPPKGGLFSCGGYTKSPLTNELIPIPEVICYNKSTKIWTYVTNIPNLTKLNSIAVDDNILIISERQKSIDPDEEDDFIPVSKFDLIHRKWLMIDKKEISDIKIQETKTD